MLCVARHQVTRRLSRPSSFVFFYFFLCFFRLATKKSWAAAAAGLGLSDRKATKHTTQREREKGNSERESKNNNMRRKEFARLPAALVAKPRGGLNAHPRPLLVVAVLHRSYPLRPSFCFPQMLCNQTDFLFGREMLSVAPTAAFKRGQEKRSRHDDEVS